MLIEIIKYIISVIIGFIIDISFFYILTNFLEIHYLISSIISITTGFFINYSININWVFKKRKYEKNPYIEFKIMILISIFVAIINIIFLFLLIELLEIYYIYSKIYASLFTFILKYLLRKNILYNIN